MGFFDGKFAKRTLDQKPSATFGTKARIDALNSALPPDQHIIDLSIGTIDEPPDERIDEFVINRLRDSHYRALAHQFTAVEGLMELREAIVAEVRRHHRLEYSATNEVIVTPSGIKGALNLAMQTLITAGDKVAVFNPTWPHYEGLIQDASGELVRISPADPKQSMRITPKQLELQLERNMPIKALVLGDLMNPTGICYSTEELQDFANVLAKPKFKEIIVFFDCPYTSHIRANPLPSSFATLTGNDGHGHTSSMRDRTLTFMGPGKVYGMHGDRVGYILGPEEAIGTMKRIQVNTSSFPANVSQYAMLRAMKDDMDGEVARRAELARSNCELVIKRLSAVPELKVPTPDQGYFLFVNTEALEKQIKAHPELRDATGQPIQNAVDFFLAKAGVAVIDGEEFGGPGYGNYVRINCGRDRKLLEQACDRIEKACAELRQLDIPRTALDAGISERGTPRGDEGRAA